MLQYHKTPSTGDPSLVNQHFPPLDIELLCCHFWWLKEWHHRSLPFPYWRFYWNANSGAVVTLNGEKYRLDPDHVVLIPPNVPFSTDLEFPSGTHEHNSDYLLGGPATGLNRINWDNVNNAVYHFFVHFTAGLPYDEIEPDIFRFCLDSATDNILHSILAEWEAEEKTTISCPHNFEIKALIAHTLAKVPVESWPTVPADERIRAAVDRIKTALHVAHPNSALAAEANMSSNAFARLFKWETGRSPQDFILEHRIKKACVMLHHSDKTIDLIAEECGFCNRHYFSRIFKREIRISPAEYRKQRHSIPE